MMSSRTPIVVDPVWEERIMEQEASLKVRELAEKEEEAKIMRVNQILDQHYTQYETALAELEMVEAEVEGGEGKYIPKFLYKYIALQKMKEDKKILKELLSDLKTLKRTWNNKKSPYVILVHEASEPLKEIVQEAGFYLKDNYVWYSEPTM